MRKNESYWQGRKMFADLKHTVEDYAKKPFKHRKPTGMSWQEYRLQLHEEKRMKLLDRLVPERRCSGCSNVYLKSKAWVVSKDKKHALCKNCHNKLVKTSNAHPVVNKILADNEYKMLRAALKVKLKMHEITAQEYREQRDKIIAIKYGPSAIKTLTRQRREDILNRLVPTRTCPVCKTPNVLHWVVKETSCVCRRCFYS